MLPLPTAPAIVTFAALMIALVVGVVAHSAETVTFAAVGLVGLGWALAATMPLARRLRRQRLELGWWLDHGTGAAGGAVVPGVPFDVRCYLRHRGRSSLEVTRVEPVVGRGVKVVEARPWRVAPSARTEATLTLVAPAAGRVVLQGLALRVAGPFGFFESALYFPNPLVIKVLPRSVAGPTLHGTTVPLAAAEARSGRTAVRRRGGGTELHELRELVPGDPFKSIAWKASARRGRLMVKEVEQEVQRTRWLILDVSGSMRGGEPGRRKMDAALEVAAGLCRQALEGGDQVGLLAFDARVVASVAPGEGKAQRIRLYEALLNTTELVDDDVTDLSERELVRLVARYVRQQDGVDYRRKGKVDIGAIVRHARRALSDPDARDVRARDATSRVLRAYCRDRGLPLPHRPDPGELAKSRALTEALKQVGGRRRDAAAITVLTDLDGVFLDGALEQALKLMRAHGHEVTFALMEAEREKADDHGALEADLRTVYGRMEDRRLRDGRNRLLALGARVSHVRPPRPRVERSAA